jgi:hypothetical protein
MSANGRKRKLALGCCRERTIDYGTPGNHLAFPPRMSSTKLSLIRMEFCAVAMLCAIAPVQDASATSSVAMRQSSAR